jgi:CarD family transcriptional regulator
VFNIKVSLSSWQKKVICVIIKVLQDLLVHSVNYIFCAGLLIFPIRYQGVLSMFNVNDTVFYPAHGVATITEVIERTVGGSVVKLHKLSFLHKDMTVLLPQHSMQGLGVRYISCEGLINDACSELWRPSRLKIKGAFDFSPSGWSRRQKEYQLKIQGGSLVEMAGVYRDIMSLSSSKELAFGEKSILHLVEELMSQEIGYARKMTRDDVVEMLKKPFRDGAFVSDFVGDALVGPQLAGSSSAL